MTTPDTSAVRAWAKKNGYQVADRGRLPAELSDAYLAANGTKQPAGVKQATTTSTARKAAPATKAAPQRKAAPKKSAPQKGGSAKAAAAPAKAASAPAKAAAVVAAPASKPAEQPRPAEAAAEKTPRPKPSVVSDDRRLVALGEEIASLTKRVEALEKASGGSKTGAGKSTRFRRRS